jgi:hypothetical protein
MGTYLSTKPMLKRACTAQLAVISTIEVAASGWSERPLILLVAPIAFVQAPSYLLAHRGIGGYRDHDALLCEDLAASCLDREVFRSERQAPIGPAPALPGRGHTLKKLNSI